jgi:hypothetical protein
MQKITTYAELQNEILFLEAEQNEKRELLKEQLYITYESLKPLSLFKNALKDLTTSPGIEENMLGSVLGLASGYLSKKVFVGTSGNMLRKLIGSVLQFGVSNIVARHPEAIKSFGKFIMEHLDRNRGVKSSVRAN